MARQEDFLFAERALQRGWVTEEHVQECLALLDRLRTEMKIEESLANLLVKKGYLAVAQASVLEAEIGKDRADRPKNAIDGYRLLERIGSGAMGSVYRADHLKLSIPVALKVLRPSLSSSRTQVERLKREAQLAARLSHPNVVRSLDVGESNGFHYLAMEFVEGDTVRDLIARGPVPEKDALAITLQVASGLAHAHAHGVVHRDVKPGNIMLAKATAKLGDFGLARGQGPSDLTLEHASIGTPQYVAPEQMRRGSDATPRSDLFSLGATLYHMVTGRPPFDGANLGEIVQNVLSCRFEPPESLAPSLSRDAIFVIDRLMRANPKERYASAADLVADLERIGRGEEVAPPDFKGDYQVFLGRRRARRNAIVATCAIALGVAGAFWLYLEQQRTEQRQLAETCRIADGTRSDVDALATLPDLRAAIVEMEKADSDAAAAGCAEESVSALRARLAASRRARGALDSAERILEGAGEPSANFRKLDAGLGTLEPVLPGVAARIKALRDEVRTRSDAAALARYEQRLGDAFLDLETAKREALAFASDLETRYLPLDAHWVASVAQAPRLLADLERQWKAVEASRLRLDDELRKDLPSYRLAASEVETLKREERAALEAIGANPYLKGLTGLAEADRRAGEVDLAERTEWARILAQVETHLAAGEPDLAETVLRGFRDRTSREEVGKRLEQATAALNALAAKQAADFEDEQDAWILRLRDRLYVGAHDAVAAAAASQRWVPEVEQRFSNLRERAQQMTALTTRFADRVRSAKRITIKGEDFAGDRIERAPGEDKDLFLAHGPKRTVEFRLSDLDRGRLEEILAFGAEDGFRRGSFYAAEAYVAEADDPAARDPKVRGPYAALGLRADALRYLDPLDPWAIALTAEIKATNERILAGEARAQRAEADLAEARAAHDQVKALALAIELCESLWWTKHCRDRMDYFRKQRTELERLAGRGLFLLEAGVPTDQLEYGGRDAPGLPAKPTSITLKGRLWHPDEGSVDPKEPNRGARLDELTRAYWTKQFAGRQEIADLVPRAMRQLLLWNGPVEVVPEGGYRPGAAAILTHMPDWWKDPNAGEPRPAGAAPDSQGPAAIELAFPFRADRDWSIEFDVEWPGGEPGYFVVTAGRIQAVVAYQKRTHGGMTGACLLVGEDLDPAAHAKEFADLHAGKEAGGGGRRQKLDGFVSDVPYRMRLERRDETIRFVMQPAGSDGEKKQVTLDRRDRKPDQLAKDIVLGDGRKAFRFFGVPGKGRFYVLRDVKITGILPEGGSEAKQ